MKKIFLIIIFSLSLFAESIESYKVDIKILPSGSLNIKEKILYDFQDSSRHGIYRDIPYLMKTDFLPKDIGLKDFSISMDSKEVKWKKFYETVNKNKFIRLKIGDPNKTLTGRHLYEISYKIEKSVLYVDKENDAIRYNAIGTGWRVPIKNIQIRLHLPPSLNKNNIKFKIYKGRFGLKEQIKSYKWINEKNLEIYEKFLNPREGITIEIVFKRGLLKQSGEKNQKASFKDYILAYWQFPLLAFILTFIYKNYLKHSVFAKKSIAVMYKPPKNIDVLQAGLIYDKFADTKDFSAAIVELAQKGYLEIFKEDKKGFLINQTPKIAIFKKTNKSLDNLSEDEKYLLKEILFKNSDTFVLEKDPYIFKKIKEGFSHINDTLYKWAVKSGYFRENPQKTRKKFLLKNILISLLFVFAIVVGSFLILPSDIILSSLFMAIFLGVGVLIAVKSNYWFARVFAFAFIAMSLFSFIPIFQNEWKYILITPLPSIVILILVITLLYKKIGDYTPKGYRTYLHLEGLKEFIKRVKEDELKRFLKQDPLFLDKLLPYAILFGLTKHWIKFYDLNEVAYPYWYHGDFSSISSFSDELESVESNFSSQNGDFGGGGFSASGGGIGGGGGGSW